MSNASAIVGVMISYPVRRRRALLGTFAPFGLGDTGYSPGYLSVQRCAKNDIEFYANFETGLRRRRPEAAATAGEQS